MKWAQTADAFIDTDRNPKTTTRPTWITGPNLKMLLHKWRHEEQAIMVGTNTALADNPMLNVREWTGNDPLRIVIDQNLSLPAFLSLFDQSIKTLVFNSQKDYQDNNIQYCKISFENNNIEQQILDELYKLKIQSLIIEGGRFLLQGFINKGLWDEAIVFQGTQFFSKGVRAPLIDSDKIFTYEIENERIFHIINPQIK